MRNNQHSHPDFKEAQTTVEFLLGPIKIKDGLFMGDQLAARVHSPSPRTSSSSSPIKLRMSSTPSPRLSPTSTNALEYSTSQCIGPNAKKMYPPAHSDLRQEEQRAQRHFYLRGGSHGAGRELPHPFAPRQVEGLRSTSSLSDEEVQLVSQQVTGTHQHQKGGTGDKD